MSFFMEIKKNFTWPLLPSINLCLLPVMKKAYKAIYLITFLFLLSSPAFSESYKIVILPFEKLNQEKNTELDTLSVGVSEILSEALTNVDNFIVIDSYRVKKYLLQNAEFKQNIGGNAQYDLDKLQKLAQSKLQGDYLVTGSFQKISGQINFIAKFIRIDNGELIKSVSIHGKYPDNIFDLQQELAKKLIEALNGKAGASQQKKINDYIGSTSNYKAYQYYIQGRVEHLKYSMKDYPKAVDFYEKAIQVDKNYALAWAGLCEVNALRGYQILYAGGNYEPFFKLAIKQGKKAVQLGKNLFQTYRALSIAYLNNSMFDDANKSIEPAWKMVPGDPEVLWVKAMLTNYGYKEMGKEGTKSHEYITKALSLNPDLIVAHWALAHSLFTLEKYDEALEEYFKILKINPEHSQTLHSVALIYYHNKDYDNTIKYVKRAIEADPDVPQHHYTLGLGYFGKSNWKNAITALKQAVHLKPDYTDAIYTLGSAYYNEGDIKEALEQYLKVKKINPDYTDADPMIARCKKELGQ